MSLWAPIQSYVDHQKNLIPMETCYLYQSGYLGSPLNQCLRRGVLTSTLHNMYLDMMQCFNVLPPLGRQLTLFRCIPQKDIPRYQVGDVVVDPAFNSASLKRNVCTYFGDVIFKIQLGHDDKLIALTGHQWFLEDVYECILPCGMQYKVTSIEHVDINGQTLVMYNVTSVGFRESSFKIDFLFDVMAEQLSQDILTWIGHNTGQSRLDHKAIFMITSSQHSFFSSEFELTSFLNIDNLSEEKRRSPIFRLICLYIDLLDNDIISLHKMTWLEARDRDTTINLPESLYLPQLKR